MTLDFHTKTHHEGMDVLVAAHTIHQETLGQAKKKPAKPTKPAASKTDKAPEKKPVSSKKPLLPTKERSPTPPPRSSASSSDVQSAASASSGASSSSKNKNGKRPRDNEEASAKPKAKKTDNRPPMSEGEKAATLAAAATMAMKRAATASTAAASSKASDPEVTILGVQKSKREEEIDAMIEKTLSLNDVTFIPTEFLLMFFLFHNGSSSLQNLKAMIKDVPERPFSGVSTSFQAAVVYWNQTYKDDPSKFLTLKQRLVASKDGCVETLLQNAHFFANATRKPGSTSSYLFKKHLASENLFGLHRTVSKEIMAIEEKIRKRSMM